jgi:hypothetical protein
MKQLMSFEIGSGASEELLEQLIRHVGVVSFERKTSIYAEFQTERSLTWGALYTTLATPKIMVENMPKDEFFNVEKKVTFNRSGSSHRLESAEEIKLFGNMILSASDAQFVLSLDYYDVIAIRGKSELRYFDCSWEP